MRLNDAIRVVPLFLVLAACGGGGGGGSGDTTPPTGTIVVAGGAAMTANLIVDLTLTAVDTGSGMGAGAQMRFSNDGVTWSPPEAFATTRTSWNLSSFGGTTATGNKTVYAMFRDVAGNWSAAVSDSIDYQGGGATISFAFDILPIFVQDCIVCHGGSGGLELDSYAHVIAGGTSGAVVIAGDPDNSLIVKRIEGTIMPQMPLGLTPLTAPEIGRIRQWILEGALNN